MQQQQSESTFKPALMLMTGRVMAFAVTFFVPAVLARVFSLAEFGTYKQFVLITYTLYAFGQVGLAECLFYFLPLNPNKAGRYAINSFLMLGMMGLLFSGFMLWDPARVAGWINNEAMAGYMPIAALFLIFMLMGTVLEITMISRKDYRTATVTYVLSDILRAFFLMVPALITGSLAWALIGGVTFCLLRVLAIVGYFWREFQSDLRFDWQLLRQQLTYAVPFFVSGVVHTVQANYHQYAVSWHFDTVTYAIYSVGCLQIPLVDFMATPASSVMMVQMGEHLREGRRERLLGIWHDTTRKLAFVFFPLVGLLMVTAYSLITLIYTPAYAASVPIFMVWSLSILFSALQTDGVLRTFAENRWLLILNVTRLIVIVLLMGWFISTFNLVGAVLITVLGIVIAKGMALVRMKTLFRTSVGQLLPWKSLGSVLVVAMLSAIPALIVNARLDVPALVLLPLTGLAYMLTYTALVLAFGLLSEGEKAALKRYLYVWNRRSAESR
jgi:O-antigen/teichoic acid export membrane protein